MKPHAFSDEPGWSADLSAPENALDSPDSRPAELPLSNAAVAALVPSDAEQESDVWIGSYAGRTMIGGFLICAMISLALWAALWFFWYRIAAPYRGVAWIVAVGLIGLIWLIQIGRWMFRKLVIGFRLTTRRLFYDRGVLYANSEYVWLNDVERVEVVRNGFERFLGIGRLQLFLRSHPAAPTTLFGVARPQRVAELIRRQVRAASQREARRETLV